MRIKWLNKALRVVLIDLTRTQSFGRGIHCRREPQINVQIQHVSPPMPGQDSPKQIAMSVARLDILL